jgi:hypothetical protein
VSHNQQSCEKCTVRQVKHALLSRNCYDCFSHHNVCEKSTCAHSGVICTSDL